MAADDGPARPSRARRDSGRSENSQTAKEYLDAQLQLEADAREALPYSFDSCTKPLGPLKQSLFSCLTCNPPPADPNAPYNAAGVCYSCSISCHGEHTLVELFTKRNFECDCGTTRLPSSAAPCTLRVDEKTGAKGVRGETPAAGNRYNQNFRNRFCGCGELYDPHAERGTMFQCLGLGTVETGGCGEDWWHPECLVGLPRRWYERDRRPEGGEGGDDGGDDDVDEPPLPPGFPGEDDFEAFLCYKCVDANPWLKRYAGTPGFLPPVYRRDAGGSAVAADGATKRKRDDAEIEEPEPKRPKEETGAAETESSADTVKPAESSPAETVKPAASSAETVKHKHDSLRPDPPSGTFSLFLREDFRDHFCRCATCYPLLAPHVQLREEEEVYEPPLSDAGDADRDGSSGGGGGNASQHTGSLLERGEAALSTLDRVRAIEGVMVYNHLRDKVKEFLKPYAERGEAVSAEAIKAYFEKLRGDDAGIRAAAAGSRGDGSGGEDDRRREQSGY